MTPKANPSSDAWTQRPADRTSQTDDARIKDITVLPPLNTSSAFSPSMARPWSR
jgi:3-deoxy-7-phosphoheptulonate synthase